MLVLFQFALKMNLMAIIPVFQNLTQCRWKEFRLALTHGTRFSPVIIFRMMTGPYTKQNEQP